MKKTPLTYTVSKSTRKKITKKFVMLWIRKLSLSCLPFSLSLYFSLSLSFSLFLSLTRSVSLFQMGSLKLQDLEELGPGETTRVLIQNQDKVRLKKVKFNYKNRHPPQKKVSWGSVLSLHCG